jgi:hypothetical protein
LTATATDVTRTVEYRTDRWFAGWLPYALLVAALGLGILIFDDGRARMAGLVLLGVGSVLGACMFYRHFHMSTPRVVLSPAGLTIRVAMRGILIPWREIEHIATIDHKVWTSHRGIPVRVTMRACTMIRIPQAFYDARVHVANPFMRGPGWEHLFIPRGKSVEIALHHEQFAIEAADVRGPIEARWRAFRGRNHPAAVAEGDAEVPPRGAPAPPSFPPSEAQRGNPASSGASVSTLGEPIRYGLPRPFLSTPLETVKLAVPLACLIVLLANALGAWETSAQQEARIERETSAEERRKEKAERDRRQKAWDDTWKKFDDDMRRVFPDHKR